MKIDKKNGLKKAKEFYQKAIEEYKRAKKQKSDVLFRDSAEKGWNAVVLATNYFINKMTGELPQSNRERRDKLHEIESKNGEVIEYNLYDRFMARMDFLHRDCFYDGIYTEEQIITNLKKVNLYIKDVEKVVHSYTKQDIMRI